MEALSRKAVEHVAALTSEKDKDTGEYLYPDLPTFFAAHFEGEDVRKKYQEQLTILEDACLYITAATAAAKKELFTKTVPADPQPPADGADDCTRGLKLTLRLWQLPFEEGLSMKGASSADAIRRTMDIFLVKGNSSETYPVEVLFKMSGQKVGEVVNPFSVGVSNGFAAVLACHCICMSAIELKWFDPDNGIEDSTKRLLGHRLLRCLRLYATYNPAPDLASQVRATLSSKIQASSRMRPSTLQMLYMQSP